MFATILYATDGSEHARKALDVVADLGHRYGATVIALTAYDPLPRDLGSPYMEELTARRLAASEALMRQVTEVLKGRGVAHAVEILEGPAPRTILDLAKSRRCELIVMGSRGLGPMGAVLVGSVSLRVVQEATCPVLIVR